MTDSLTNEDLHRALLNSLQELDDDQLAQIVQDSTEQIEDLQNLKGAASYLLADRDRLAAIDAERQGWVEK